MKISRSMLAAGIVTTIAAASVLGVGAVSAQTSNSNSLIDKIATKFGLNRDEVEAVFEEQRTEMHAQRELQREEQLQALVDDGTLTAEQKSALEAKHDEMEAARETLKDQDLTHEEMHSRMEQAREEFKTWAEEQGIDLEAIRPEGGRGRHGHRMMEGIEN